MYVVGCRSMVYVYSFPFQCAQIARFFIFIPPFYFSFLSLPTPLPTPSLLTVIISGVGLEKISDAVWDELFALPSLIFLDVSGNPELDFVPPVDAVYRFQSLNCFSLKGTDISRLLPNSLSNFGTVIDAFDISYPSAPVSNRVDMTRIFAGLTSIRATMWYNNICPAGFYSTPLNHGDAPSGL